MNKKSSEAILSDLYDLVLDPNISSDERILLLEAKNKIEKGNYFPRIMRDLERSLRPKALQSKLSKPVQKLYMTISTIGKFEEELGKGLAATSITFGGLF